MLERIQGCLGIGKDVRASVSIFVDPDLRKFVRLQCWRTVDGKIRRKRKPVSRSVSEWKSCSPMRNARQSPATDNAVKRGTEIICESSSPTKRQIEHEVRVDLM